MSDNVLQNVISTALHQHRLQKAEAKQTTAQHSYQRANAATKAKSIRKAQISVYRVATAKE